MHCRIFLDELLDYYTHEWDDALLIPHGLQLPTGSDVGVLCNLRLLPNHQHDHLRKSHIMLYQGHAGCFVPTAVRVHWVCWAEVIPNNPAFFLILQAGIV